MAGNSRVNNLAPGVLALGFFGLIFLSACQQTPLLTGRFVSEKGVNIEAAFPADTFLLAKLGTRDDQQLANLKQLNSYFPNDPLGMLVNEFKTGFEEGANLDDTGLDLEKDLLPMLSPKTEIYLATAPGKTPALENLNAILAMTLADEGKFDDLLNKQVEKGTLSREVYNDYNYFTQKDPEKAQSMLVRMKDVAFVFTDLQTFKSGLDNVSINNVVLNNNQVYQRAMKQYLPSVAFVYGDFPKLVDFLKKIGTDGEQVIQAMSSAGVSDSRIDMVESETIIMSLEKDGIRLSANLLGKENADLTKSGQISKSYLAEKIPSKYPVIYSEAYNLKSVYENFLKLSETDAEMKDGLSQMKEFLAGQDLDLEKDVLSFLDKGYAFVLEDTDSTVPALGVYFDVSGNPAGAVKVAGKISQAVDEIWVQAMVENPELDVFLSKEEVIQGKLWKIAVNIDSLLVGAPSEITKKLSGQKIEFYYGVLPENILVIAFKPDLEKVYGKSPTVAEAPEYKQALSYLRGADKGVSYLSPSQFFVYADRVLKLVNEISGKTEDLTQYEQIKSYVLPFKSLAVASGGVEKNKISAEAFVHISQ